MVLDSACAGFHVKQGGVLAYPTESVWGLGCDATCADGYAKLCALKTRPSQGMIVLARPCHIDTLRLPKYLHARLRARQARPTTWLVPQSAFDCVPLCAHAGMVAIRFVQFLLLQNLCQSIESADNPMGLLVSTSCNLHKAPPARTLAQAYNYFGDKVAYLNDNNRIMPSQISPPSQIVELLTGKIVRA